MEQNRIIYKFTFPDGKVYIGQTGQDLDKRWSNGEGYKGQPVYVPITLAGWDNIKKEILHTNLTTEQANKLEQYYIHHFNSIQNGYNISTAIYANSRRIKFAPIQQPNDIILKLIPFIADSKGSTIKLLLYLLQLSLTHPNETIPFYPKVINETIKISEGSLRTAFQELIDMKCLVLIEDSLYLFDFENAFQESLDNL